MGADDQIPKMKVFTVGLDQKPPLEESKSPPSPPPGYVSPPASVIMGPPEPTPIIIRKSRGYKGVLIVLLSVFLIALFALTLSEIAYNRQRDENFFRLRWAELKHRMGWGDYDGAHRWQERVYNFHRVPEFNQQPPPFDALQAQPIVPVVQKNTEIPKTEKSEKEDQNKKNSIADRLQFFKQLLEGIKKQAENMGFDGTMQVSVVQVDPLSQQVEDQDPKSESFLDGFGEVHQPQQGIMEKSGSNSNENEMRLRRPCGFFKCEENGDEMPNFQLPRMGPFRPDWMHPRFDGEDDKVGNFFPKVEMIEIPVDQQEVGTMYGKKFGLLLQEIIANRLKNFQQMNFNPPRPDNFNNMQAPWWQPMRPNFPQSFPMGNGVEFNGRPFHQQQQQQQPQTPPPFIFFPNPQPNHFPRNRMDNGPNMPNQQNIAPEDRIQIEPPTERFHWKPDLLFPSPPENENTNGFVNLNNEINRGWTHHEQAPQGPVEQQLPKMEQQIPQVEPQVPQQNGASMPAVEPEPPMPRPIHDGETGKKSEEKSEEKMAPEGPQKHEEEQQQKPIPILAIDPPMPSFTMQESKPQVDFPAVKFPMNDESNPMMNNREHNPLFFQVDEPLQTEQQQTE